MGPVPSIIQLIHLTSLDINDEKRQDGRLRLTLKIFLFTGRLGKYYRKKYLDRRVAVKIS